MAKGDEEAAAYAARLEASALTAAQLASAHLAVETYRMEIRDYIAREEIKLIERWPSLVARARAYRTVVH
jgi:hypothetical protein